MSIPSFLARSSLAAVAVVIGGCRLSDVQDPAMLRTLAAGRASDAAQPNRDKIDICHWSNENSEFILISVASPAVDAHVAHGDGRPGEAVPHKTGLGFSPTCQPENIPFDVTLHWSAVGMILDTDKNEVGDEIFLNDPSLKVFNEPTREQHGILEFGIAQFSQPIGHAELTLDLGASGFIQPYLVYVSIFSYAGDGAVTLSDFLAGSLATQFACRKPGADGVNSFECVAGTTITRDVTAALNSLIALQAKYAGFNLIVSGGYPGVFSLDGNANPALPTARLRVRSP